MPLGIAVLGINMCCSYSDKMLALRMSQFGEAFQEWKCQPNPESEVQVVYKICIWHPTVPDKVIASPCFLLTNIFLLYIFQIDLKWLMLPIQTVTWQMRTHHKPRRKVREVWLKTIIPMSRSKQIRSKPSELTGEQDGRAGENSEAEGLEEGRSSSSLTDASGNAAEDAVTDEEGGTVRNGSSEPEQVNGCSAAKMAAGPASCEDVKEEAGDANPFPEDSAGVKLEVNAGGKDAGSPEQNDGGQTPEMQDTNAVDCQKKGGGSGG